MSKKLKTSNSKALSIYSFLSMFFSPNAVSLFDCGLNSRSAPRGHVVALASLSFSPLISRGGFPFAFLGVFVFLFVFFLFFVFDSSIMGAGLSKKAKERLNASKREGGTELNFSECGIQDFRQFGPVVAMNKLVILNLSRNYIVELPPTIERLKQITVYDCLPFDTWFYFME